MTANPDSALRQALVAAEKHLRAIIEANDRYREDVHPVETDLVTDACNEARADLALITEALQRGEKV